MADLSDEDNAIVKVIIRATRTPSSMGISRPRAIAIIDALRADGYKIMTTRLSRT